ncbi:hypothetical protein GCM10009647_079590 [Streptomyces sanglieri]
MWWRWRRPYPPDPLRRNNARAAAHREARARLQLGLHRDGLRLHELGLVKTAPPANGEQPDLVAVTESGRTALG